MRLDLIDQPKSALLVALDQKRKRLAEDLREVGPKIRSVRGSINAMKSEAVALPDLKTQLITLQAERPARPPELEQERKSFLQRRGILEALRQSSTIRKEIAQDIMIALQRSSDLDELIEVIRAPGDERTKAAISPIASFREDLAKIEELIDANLLLDLDAPIREIEFDYQRDDVKYHTLRQEALSGQ